MEPRVVSTMASRRIVGAVMVIGGLVIVAIVLRLVSSVSSDSQRQEADCQALLEENRRMRCRSHVVQTGAGCVCEGHTAAPSTPPGAPQTEQHGAHCQLLRQDLERRNCTPVATHSSCACHLSRNISDTAPSPASQEELWKAHMAELTSMGCTPHRILVSVLEVMDAKDPRQDDTIIPHVVSAPRCLDCLSFNMENIASDRLACYPDDTTMRDFVVRSENKGIYFNVSVEVHNSCQWKIKSDRRSSKSYLC